MSESLNLLRSVGRIGHNSIFSIHFIDRPKSFSHGIYTFLKCDCEEVQYIRHPSNRTTYLSWCCAIVRAWLYKLTAGDRMDVSVNRKIKINDYRNVLCLCGRDEVEKYEFTYSGAERDGRWSLSSKVIYLQLKLWLDFNHHIDTKRIRCDGIDNGLMTNLYWDFGTLNTNRGRKGSKGERWTLDLLQAIMYSKSEVTKNKWIAKHDMYQCEAWKSISSTHAMLKVHVPKTEKKDNQAQIHEINQTNWK